MKNDPKELLSVVAWMISMNRCLISLIAYNGEYFDLCRKVSQKEDHAPGQQQQQLETRDR